MGIKKRSINASSGTRIPHFSIKKLKIVSAYNYFYVFLLKNLEKNADKNFIFFPSRNDILKAL